MADKPINLNHEILTRNGDESCTPDNLLRAFITGKFDEIVILGVRYNKDSKASYKTAWSQLEDTHRTMGMLTEIIHDLQDHEDS